MPSRYSREELKEIISLVAQGLSSREIGLRLGRSEAGIKNVRYRLNLRKRIEDNIGSLNQKKEDLESKVVKLIQRKDVLSSELTGLLEKKKHLESELKEDEESLRRKIELKLLGLKNEKPQLFYISGEEQFAKLIAEILRLLIS